MNPTQQPGDSPPEEVRNEAPEEQDRSPEQPEQKPQTRPPRERRNHAAPGVGFLYIAVAALSVTVVLLLLVIARMAGFRFPWEKALLKFEYNGSTYTAVEGVPLNPYDPALFVLDGDGRLQYENEFGTSRTGVDVSSHQKEVDWEAVADDGIEFAMLRIGYRGYTEGGLFADKCFEVNYSGATEAGLDVGVYFYSQAVTPEEAEEEARFILDTLDGRTLACPVAFDWEPVADGPARTDGLDGDTLTDCADAFLRTIRDGGFTACLYTNRDHSYTRYDLSRLKDWPVWLADYRNRTDYVYDFSLWQYTHTAEVAGIEGPVDLNLDLGPCRDQQLQ